MILKGSQRSGAGQLARHLLRTDENEHVTVEQLRGFTSDNLPGALTEAQAIAKGTRCKQYLFSLSLNPPKDGNATRDDLVAAADEAEKRLGLTGCPRAIVIHEKSGRRHAHAVWSRIDPLTLKAVNLPFFKTRLAELSKQLYLDHGWELPEGHKENGKANPLNFDLAEWQQAKRGNLDPRALKGIFQDAWKRSDDLESFRNALAERGFFLAKGDRRGLVAVDLRCEVYSVARMVGIRTKELEARLGSPENLPRLDFVKGEINARIRVRVMEALQPALVQMARNNEAAKKQSQLPSSVPAFKNSSLRPAFADALNRTRRQHRRELAPLRWKRRQIVRAQRAERVQLSASHRQARTAGNKARVLRVKDWAQGALQHLTGDRPFIRQKHANESYEEYQRYRRAVERQFEQQLEELRALQVSIDKVRARQQAEQLALIARMALVVRLQRDGERNARENRPEQLVLEL